ncbi:MAG: SH3 domain-containing protein [Clostridia bacterium]|nr:SH3 domain-containing protein [Clostridia bacterium]
MAMTRRKWISFLLCLCLLTTLFANGVLFALAATKATGTVFGIDPGSYLSVRKTASTSGTLIDKIYNDQVVTIEDTVSGSNKTWYKISYTKNGQAYTGYSSAEFIRINKTYETDEDFETHLTKQGFPEDYKVKLREIHAHHPQWVFMADKLTMTWSTALKEESKALKNAITKPDAWKSMEYGAYNWSTGKYVEVDSGGWVTAAPAVVAYYMDPRNWLDTSYVFQFENLQYSDKHTVDGVKAILPSGLDKFAEDLLKAAKETKVSAYFLATRMRQEGSKILGTWEGDDGVTYKNVYNFFNYGAYAGDQYGAYRGAVTNGAIYAQRQGWDTPYKCLVGSAKKIGDGYINKEQNTLYYQKFDVTDGGNGFYGHQYMTNVQAPSSEGKIRANSLTDAEKNGALTFIIPVYMEMSKTAAPKPSETGNNNNFLDSLTVKGHSLTPSFDRYDMTYSVHAGNATQIEVTGVLNNKDAKLTGGGKVQLFKGDNEVKLTVTATSGEQRTYTVIVTTTGGEERPDAPVITGKIYSISDTVTKVEPQTALDKFIGNLAVSNGTAKIFTTDGKEKTTGHVATGDILRLYSGEVLCASYPILIYGDVNGDGKVSSIDLRMMQKHILNVASVEHYSLIAADVNKDDKISSIDLRMSQKYILGITTTLQ